MVLDPTLDLLALNSFPRLAAAVHSRREAILRRWEQVEREVLPTADDLTFTQLRSSLPGILEQIADALGSDQPAETRKLGQVSKSHGQVRFHQHYNVNELVVEYRLLRRVIIEEVWQAMETPLSQQQAVALDMAIDTVLHRGVVAFVDYQREQIRSACEVESKYLSFLSHDLRNHLNHATLVMQLLKGNLAGIPECADSLKELEGVQRSILETTTGMERLLQAERLRKGAVEAKCEPVDLRRLVSDVLGQFAGEAKGKGLTLTAQVPAAASVQSDRQLIALVLHNLVGNAVKYSAQGEVRVEVRSLTSEDGEGSALSVTDQGPGIPADDLERIFQAFVRGQTQGQPGVGLGLCIAAQATKVLGGRLNVESKPGVGSTFELVLLPRPVTATACA